MKKGYQYERELKKILEKQFFCVRIAGSGNKTPDLIVGKNNKFILIEVKKNFRKIREQETAFNFLSKKYNIKILYAFKIPYKGWFFEKDGKIMNLDEFLNYLENYF
jgi:Holliday junction resolvase